MLQILFIFQKLKRERGWYVCVRVCVCASVCVCACVRARVQLRLAWKVIQHCKRKGLFRSTSFSTRTVGHPLSVQTTTPDCETSVGWTKERQRCTTAYSGDQYLLVSVYKQAAGPVVLGQNKTRDLYGFMAAEWAGHYGPFRFDHWKTTSPLCPTVSLVFWFVPVPFTVNIQTGWEQEASRRISSTSFQWGTGCLLHQCHNVLSESGRMDRL